MSLFSIALKSIRQRGLASTLTALSVALGVGLLVCVLLIHSIVSGMFNQSASGYDLIIGPKGSGLQLVLNTVYRLSQPIENLPYKFYQELQQDKRIEAAVPFALGDFSEEGAFPIVGTISDYFLLEYAPGKKFQVTKSSQQMTNPFDAVIGSRVARVNGWKIGTELRLIHGGADVETGDIHEEKFRIVAILQPTGTPNDRTVFVNLEGFFLVQGHEKPLDEALLRIADFDGEKLDEPELINRMALMFNKYEHLLEKQESLVYKYPAILLSHPKLFENRTELVARTLQNDPTLINTHPKLKELYPAALTYKVPEKQEAKHEHHEDYVTPDEQKEVTAVLVRMKETRAGTRALRAIQLQGELKEGLQAQAVNPVRQISWLMRNLVGNIRTMLLVMTVLIVVVSGVGIFVSIYNSMADRRREIAIMRALGASRTTVFSIILMESILLCLSGGIAGMLMGHGLVVIGSPFLEARTGILLNPWTFETLELILIPILLGLASLVGFIPAMTAYRTDVAQTLAD